MDLGWFENPEVQPLPRVSHSDTLNPEAQPLPRVSHTDTLNPEAQPLLRVSHSEARKWCLDAGFGA